MKHTTRLSIDDMKDKIETEFDHRIEVDVEKVSFDDLENEFVVEWRTAI